MFTQKCGCGKVFFTTKEWQTECPRCWEEGESAHTRAADELWDKTDYGFDDEGHSTADSETPF